MESVGSAMISVLQKRNLRLGVALHLPKAELESEPRQLSMSMRT